MPKLPVLSGRKLLRALGKLGYAEVRCFVLNKYVGEKFRRTNLIPSIKNLEIDSLAEGLSLTMGKPLYLYWKML